MFYRSIRFKIAIAYMAMLTVTLALFSAILYQYVSHSLYDNMDSLLSSKAEGLVHAIDAYWAWEKFEPWRSASATEEVYAREEGVNFSSVVQKWLQEKSKDPKLLDIIVQIFDDSGETITASKNTQGISTVSGETFRSVLSGKSSFATLASSFPTKKLQQYRVFLMPAIQAGKVEYVVQVASPLTSIETTLTTLKITMWTLLPLTVLFTGILGLLIAHLTLRPVNRMIQEIHDITAESLRSKIAIPGTKDEIQRLAETFNDMLERLHLAFTTQRQFFENLSHELKTPLTVMKGEFEVILKKNRTPDEYESVLKSNLEEIDKIVKLVENLLLLASFESQKILPERREVDLGLLLSGVANTYKKLADRKGIDIRMGLEEHIIIVEGDEQQLKQLFANLFDNAVKYTLPHGKVEARCAKGDGLATVSITDTGVGIPKDKIGRIFDRFYRAGATTGEGFGLGLSIAKSVVDAHKGSISVRSEIGEGTTFTVSLPLTRKG